jgi:hypothetical protein
MPVIPGEPMVRHLARVAAEAVAGQAPGTCTLPRSLPECGQCQAAARLPADGRPAARAALSFSGPVSQVTTAAPPRAAGRQPPGQAGAPAARGTNPEDPGCPGKPRSRTPVMSI